MKIENMPAKASAATTVRTLTRARAVVGVSEAGVGAGCAFPFAGTGLAGTFADIAIPAAGGSPLPANQFAIGAISQNASLDGNDPAVCKRAQEQPRQLAAGTIANPACSRAFTNAAAANISITKTDNLSGFYSPDDTGIYAITIINVFDAKTTAMGVTVGDLLPKDLVIAVSEIACNGPAGGASCIGSGNLISTDSLETLNVLSGLLLTLSPGGKVTVTIPVSYGSNKEYCFLGRRTAHSTKSYYPTCDGVLRNKV